MVEYCGFISLGIEIECLLFRVVPDHYTQLQIFGFESFWQKNDSHYCRKIFVECLLKCLLLGSFYVYFVTVTKLPIAITPKGLKISFKINQIRTCIHMILFEWVVYRVSCSIHSDLYCDRDQGNLYHLTIIPILNYIHT